MDHHAEIERLNLAFKNLQETKDVEMAKLYVQLEADRVQFTATINDL